MLWFSLGVNKNTLNHSMFIKNNQSISSYFIQVSVSVNGLFDYKIYWKILKK